MKLTDEQIKILEKYNIDYKVDSVDDLLINIDLIMTKYLDKNDEPTKDYMVLEKLYDEVYDLEDTK